MQLGASAVEEVGGRLPDVVHETVAERELRHVGHVVLQSVVPPSLPEVHLHGV